MNRSWTRFAAATQKLFGNIRLRVESNSGGRNFAPFFLGLAGVVFFSIACLANDATQRLTDSSVSSADMTQQFSDQPRQMQIRLNLPEKQPLKGNADTDALKGGLSQLELKRLAAHDIVLMIDKSYSMSTLDCPLAASGKLAGLSSVFVGLAGGLGGLAASRWEWCLHQTAHMVKQTEQVLANGFTVVLFDHRYYIFQHVTVPQLSNIFNENHPGGGTNLGRPLSCTLNDYFRRKRISNGNVKPLLIGVITDGCPHDTDAVEEEVVSAERAVHDPGEITIVFFLIGGNDPGGNRFVWHLCHDLGRQGARFELVKAVPFNELQRLGLARALADNLE